MKKVVAPVTFEFKPSNNTTLPAEDRLVKVKFQREVTELSRAIQGAGFALREMDDKLKHIRAAIGNTPSKFGDCEGEVSADFGRLAEGFGGDE